MSRRADNFFLGVFFDAVFSSAFYLLLTVVLKPLTEATNFGSLFFYPKPELFTLIATIILFRVFMINLQMQKFGKGWLLGVFIFALGFFYKYYHQ